MAKVTVEFKVSIESSANDLSALKTELAHARRTLAGLIKTDDGFNIKHHKMTSQRVWLKDRIKEWGDKVGALDGMVIDYKAQAKVRARERKWEETKRKAGYGATNG